MILQRFANTPQGTPGRLDGRWYTMERPDLDNAPMLSRIPAGLYECVMSWYHRGEYNTYEITNVRGRTRILFHLGNRMTDVNGCVALGMSFGVLGNEIAVLQSADAFQQFMAELRGRLSFDLDIRDE